MQRIHWLRAHLLHPHIVAVFDSGQDGPHHYIASAFIEGRPLDAVLLGLSDGQTLPLRQTVHDIVQRDLKLTNDQSKEIQAIESKYYDRRTELRQDVAAANSELVAADQLNEVDRALSESKTARGSWRCGSLASSAAVVSVS